MHPFSMRLLPRNAQHNSLFTFLHPPLSTFNKSFICKKKKKKKKKRNRHTGFLFSLPRGRKFFQSRSSDRISLQGRDSFWSGKSRKFLLLAQYLLEGTLCQTRLTPYITLKTPDQFTQHPALCFGHPSPPAGTASSPAGPSYPPHYLIFRLLVPPRPPLPPPH